MQSEASPGDTSIPTGSADPESRILVLNKVYLYGLDHFTSKDLEALAQEYYSTETYERIEWIDDSSANLVFANSEIAADALRAFAAIDIGDVSQLPIQQMIPAKAFPGHPETTLQIRLAVMSDKKLPKAHERSRFYLIHPEYDPASRRNRGYRTREPLRHRDIDDPRSNGGGRRGRLDDLDDTFNEAYYDDDEASISSRRRGGGSRQSSRGSFSSGDGLRGRVTRGIGKELFPDRSGGGKSAGRLRDRSASPARDFDHVKSNSNGPYDVQKENRRKAQLLKATLQAKHPRPANNKELFPHKATHRRSDAFDAADETADLFANRMPVPFTDGGSDEYENRKRGSNGFSIRGAARQQSSGGFSIKGAAKSEAPKELFPTRSRGGNAGKELLGGSLESRITRRRAEDMFS